MIPSLLPHPDSREAPSPALPTFVRLTKPPRRLAPRTLRHMVGRHLLYRGDCMRVLGTLSEASVDVVVTSPPYNLGLKYGTYHDRRDETEYLDWLIDCAGAIKRVMRPDASFFLNMTGSSSRPWLPFELMVRLRSLFHLQNHITWVKSISVGDDSLGHFKPIRSERYLHRNHEHIFHLTQSGSVPLKRLAVGVPYKDKTNITRRGHQQDLRCRGDTWFIPYSTVQARAQKFDHPAAFPVMLPRMCIRLHGKRNPVVLDPFMGSGTSLVAAEEEGARGIGIELDSAYVSAARSRLLSQFRVERAA